MNNTYKIGLVGKSYVADSIGNMIEQETISYVFADLKSISAKEFFDEIHEDYSAIFERFETGSKIYCSCF